MEQFARTDNRKLQLFSCCHSHTISHTISLILIMYIQLCVLVRLFFVFQSQYIITLLCVYLCVYHNLYCCSLTNNRANERASEATIFDNHTDTSDERSLFGNEHLICNDQMANLHNFHSTPLRATQQLRHLTCVQRHQY